MTVVISLQLHKDGHFFLLSFHLFSSSSLCVDMNFSFPGSTFTTIVVVVFFFCFFVLSPSCDRHCHLVLDVFGRSAVFFFFFFLLLFHDFSKVCSRRKLQFYHFRNSFNAYVVSVFDFCIIVAARIKQNALSSLYLLFNCLPPHVLLLTRASRELHTLTS